MGRRLTQGLRALGSKSIREVRGRGLLIGMEVDAKTGGARRVCEQLMRHGILTRETRETVVRLAPPLIVTAGQIDAAVAEIGAALDELNP